MPYYYDDYYARWLEKKRRDAHKRKELAKITTAWRAGEISWNTYIRLEKRYRV